MLIYKEKSSDNAGDKRKVTILFSATTILSAVFQPIK